MNVLLPILAAIILVVAQASWKKAFSSASFALSANFLLSKQFFSIILSPYFIFGSFLYVAATIFYMYLFSRFTFYSVQSIMLVTSITLTFLISAYIFKEPITLYKIGGLGLLILGIILIFKK